MSGRREVGKLLIDFYSHLFASENSSSSDDLEGIIQQVITDAENTNLIKIPDKEEVRATLGKMKADKALGPDGMTTLFYDHFWKIVGDDVVKTVQQFFKEGFLLQHLNVTNLVLIPKVEHPSLVNQFRPISLCNVIYKVISKTMADRLKVVLPRLVSPFQLAFVLGRQIQDNYIAAVEIFHLMNHKRGGVVGWLSKLIWRKLMIEWSEIFC